MAATRQSPLVRTLLTIALILGGIGLSTMFLLRGKPAPTPAPAAAPAPQPSTTTTAQPASPTASASPGAAPANVPSEPAAAASTAGAPPAAAPPAQVPALRVRPAPEIAALDPLGDIDPASGHKLRVAFTQVGAGVESITLAEHKARVGSPERYAVQQRREYLNAAGQKVVVASMATLGVEIDGAFVDLYSDAAGESRWTQKSPGEFEALIEDAAGTPVARIHKRFILQPGKLDIALEQRLVNLTDRALAVRWYQYGPVELELEGGSYGGDMRRLRYGYLANAQVDPSRQIVLPDRKLDGRQTVAAPTAARDKQVWPTPDSARAGEELAWLALTNRYFTFAVHPTLDDAAIASATAVDKRLRSVETAHRVLLGLENPANTALHSKAAPGVIALQLTSPSAPVAPGASADFSIGAYAGPLLRDAIDSDPAHRALNLGALVVYNLGGFCGPCTFSWLANPLIWILHTAHNYLFHDWALAVMFLVLCVRTLLHPVTRKSQIGMTRFGKQMAALAPKQAALREKFKDDPKRLQGEMARLMKEEGVSFTGALGCLPAFLQTPVWIALYAALYFAFELRHQPAYFGVFQALSGGNWSFLADLSAPDHFFELANPIHIPLISGLLGPISGFNVLPILLGVVFFIQQKYLTPPPSTALTPEQEMQQKMMKIMMVVMFPLLMYNAPSGLAIYFITNSTLGILESRWIRSHIDTLDLAKKSAGPGPAPGSPGAGGSRQVRGKPSFLERVQAEALRRAEQAKANRRAGPNGKNRR